MVPSASPLDLTEVRRIPELDGLRAVAVYLVVVFHAGVARFEGGFIGVDVFFVLSGFLITHLILTERSRHGRVDLLGFYARRIRRLLPASAGAIVGTTIAFTAFASPLERSSVLGDARAAVFYVANWNFIGSSEDYFADSLDASPFLHLWSLAVEEQFYLVWPLTMLVVGTLWCRSDRARLGVNIGLAGAAIGGCGWAFFVASDSPLRSYYGTDTRAYQLLAGALIAGMLTVPGGGMRRWLSGATSETMVVLGAAGIIFGATVLDADPAARGLVACLATGLLIIGAASRVSTNRVAVSRLLATRPLTLLGDRSYATYLWHWPLIVILERTLVIGDVTMAIVVSIAATGIAHISMDLVERPIRRRSANSTRRQNWRVVAVAGTATVVIGLGIVPAVLHSDVGQIQAVERPGFTTSVAAGTGTPVPDGVLDVTEAIPIPAPPVQPSATQSSSATTPTADTVAPAGNEKQVDMPTPIDAPIGVNIEVVGNSLDENDGCVNDAILQVESCVVVNGTGERILLVGDSHANKLNVMLAEHAVQTGRSLATVSMVACPWQRGLLYEFKMVNEGARQVCRDQRIDLYERVLESYQPDVVIATSHDLTSDTYTVMASGDTPELDALSTSDLLEAATADSLDRFVASGARIVVIEPLPNSPFDAKYCVDAASTIEECQFAVLDWPAAETPFYRSVAELNNRVTTADLTDIVCPRFPTCDPIIDGVLVREDLDHLSLDFTRLMAPRALPRFGL
jgi:peptidoglycan/LPS O-acetylase OafA/YrhL